MADITVYESYVKSVEKVWESANCDIGMFFGDFNLPKIIWNFTDLGLTFSGAHNDKDNLKEDQFISMDFLQLNIICNSFGSLLDLCFSNANTAVIEQALDSLVPCDKYHPPAPLALKYKLPILLIMADDKHCYRDFKNADYNSTFLSLTDNNLISTLIQQPSNTLASVLQHSIIDSINHFVSLKTYHRSSFPKWVSTNLKSLIFHKKAHKNSKQ